MEEAPGEQPVRNTAGFQTPGQPDRSPAGLQFQSYQLGTSATGVNGISRRAAPDYNVLFANRNMSGAQNGGGHAKSTFGEE